MIKCASAKRLGAPVLAGALALTFASCSSSKSARKDVKITACTADPSGGKPTAHGTIVNHSSKASVYTIHVKFKDSSGNGVGDGFSAVARVDPGEQAKWDSKGTVSAKGPLKCSLDSVTRNAAP
jgi:hypothetical protein